MHAESTTPCSLHRTLFNNLNRCAKSWLSTLNFLRCRNTRLLSLTLVVSVANRDLHPYTLRETPTFRPWDLVYFVSLGPWAYSSVNRIRRYQSYIRPKTVLGVKTMRPPTRAESRITPARFSAEGEGHRGVLRNHHWFCLAPSTIRRDDFGGGLKTWGMFRINKP